MALRLSLHAESMILSVHAESMMMKYAPCSVVLLQGETANPRKKGVSESSEGKKWREKNHTVVWYCSTPTIHTQQLMFVIKKGIMILSNVLYVGKIP